MVKEKIKILGLQKIYFLIEFSIMFLLFCQCASKQCVLSSFRPDTVATCRIQFPVSSQSL